MICEIKTIYRKTLDSVCIVELKWHYIIYIFLTQISVYEYDIVYFVYPRNSMRLYFQLLGKFQ